MPAAVDRTPTEASIIRGAIERRLESLHTTMPGRVESYDAGEQTATVQPLIRRGILDERGERIVESLPVIVRVPIVFPGAGGFRITFPVKAGDEVLLLFAEASLDRWLVKGGEVDPGDPRRFDLSDAIAIPGLASVATAPGTHASALVVEGSDIRLGSAEASDPVVRLSDLQKVINGFLNGVPAPADGGVALQSSVAANWVAAGVPSGSGTVKTL